MRKATLGLVASLALALVVATAPAYGQVNAYVTGGRVVASAFGQWSARSTNAITSGSQTLTVDRCIVPAGNGIGVMFVPWAVNVPITIVDSNSETVTPTAVVTPSAGSTTGCSVTATFSNAHGAGATVKSGDGGLGEAIVNIKGTGGTVVLDPTWSGSTAQITGAAIGALPSSSNIYIEDIRSSPPVGYAWNGTAAFAAVSQPLAAVNGAALVPFVNSELLTLSTSGATTDTTGNLLPANSLVVGVTGRVTTTITGCSGGWELGDATTAARFTATDTTLTAGETMPNATHPPVNVGTGIASATTGMFQAAAAKVRVTCTTSNASAGVVRITAFGYTIVPPQE